MRFLDLAATSAAVARPPVRNAKIDLLAEALRPLAPAEVAPGAAYLAGELRQRQTGVGWATLRDLPPPADGRADRRRRRRGVRARSPAGAGTGSQAAPAGAGRRALRRRHRADEQRLLIGLLSGELRQGAQAGLLADAVARAAGVPITAVRRALLLAGDLQVGRGRRADRRAPTALDAYRLAGRPAARADARAERRRR